MAVELEIAVSMTCHCAIHTVDHESEIMIVHRHMCEVSSVWCGITYQSNVSHELSNRGTTVNLRHVQPSNTKYKL